MKNPSKKQRIKALENEVSTLRASLYGFMSFIGYEDGDEREPVKIIDIEPYDIFQQGLRDIEAKYALKVS
jgi:hypothetical protein